MYLHLHYILYIKIHVGMIILFRDVFCVIASIRILYSHFNFIRISLLWASIAAHPFNEAQRCWFQMRVFQMETTNSCTENLLFFNWKVLGGGFRYFFKFHPETWGKIFNLTSIFFQMGWFNHQRQDRTTICLCPVSFGTFFLIRKACGTTVWVRRGGPNYSEGLTNMARACED